ncbi:hypothetical protein [uncultured Paraglaciecola sp.]|uniref:hypothetical protein n=1 Tax=uncultured Paraglaciecola sp. TaxID=1765024 RepID=UPI00260878E7|nr:hypothetical protein [uncultured Paraglaciecola sp.]
MAPTDPTEHAGDATPFLRITPNDVRYHMGRWVFRKTLLGRPITIEGDDQQRVINEAIAHSTRLLNHANRAASGRSQGYKPGTGQGTQP